MEYFELVIHWKKQLAGVVLAGLVGLGGLGCSWNISAPTSPEFPEAVFVTEYGRHTRVALPEEPGRFVEYGFGEWNYYGLEEHSNWSGFRAITGMGVPAVSRRTINSQPVEETFLRVSGGSKTARLEVDRREIERLRGKLEARWTAASDNAMRVRALDGVPVAREETGTYHLFRNSNSEAAEWLRELGCEVRGGPAVFSNWEVDGR